MDEPLVVLGVTLPLIVALAGLIWWLVAGVRRDRRRQQIAADWANHYQTQPDLLGRRAPAHLFRRQGEAIPVAELLREAAQHSEGIRLNWPEEGLDEPRRMRPYSQDQIPTTIFPKVEGNGDIDDG